MAACRVYLAAATFRWPSPSSLLTPCRALARLFPKSKLPRTASCRLLAGRDLVPIFIGAELFASPSSHQSTKRLALCELESLSRALLPVLLPFLHARVACQKSVGAQSRSQLRIEARNGARQSHAHRSSLAAYSAAVRRNHHVHLIGQAGELQRLNRVMFPREVREIHIHRPLIDRELAASRAQKHTRHRFLAPSRSVDPCLESICRRFSAQLSS